MVSSKDNQDNRTINIGGNVSSSVMITGNKSRVTTTFDNSINTAISTDIAQEISLIKEALSSLNFEHQLKVNNALSEAQFEADAEEKDKLEIGSALERALKYAKKAEDFSASIERIKPHVINVASWLGGSWLKLVNYLN